MRNSDAHPLAPHGELHDWLIIRHMAGPVLDEIPDPPTANDFVRMQMREQGFMRQIMPPLEITNDELDRSVPTDQLAANEYAHFANTILGEPYPYTDSNNLEYGEVVRQRPYRPQPTSRGSINEVRVHQRRASHGLERIGASRFGHLARLQIQRASEAFREHWEMRCIGQLVTGPLIRAYEELYNAGAYDEICEIYCRGGFNIQGVTGLGRLAVGVCAEALNVDLDLTTLPSGWRVNFVDRMNQERPDHWPHQLRETVRTVAARIVAFVRGGHSSCCYGPLPHAQLFSDASQRGSSGRGLPQSDSFDVL